MYWIYPVFACRWVRWKWTVSSNPSVSRCSVNWSLRPWRRWICPCQAASAWGATAMSEPLRRAAPRMMSVYRCGPPLLHVQPPRWGPSRAVLVSNKKGSPQGWWKGKVCFCAALSDQRWDFLMPVRESVSPGSWTDWSTWNYVQIKADAVMVPPMSKRIYSGLKAHRSEVQGHVSSHSPSQKSNHNLARLNKKALG